MNSKKGWQEVLRILGVVSIFLTIFGSLWLLAEPIGVKPGVPTFIFLTFGAIIILLIWLLIRNSMRRRNEREELTQEIMKLRQQLKEKSHLSNCCIREQEAAVCPLGVTKIYDHSIETLESSLLEARHSYKWFGYSAFNVVHNHREIFEEQNSVRFEFVTLDPNAERLLSQVDKDFHATLKAKDQAQRGKEIITELADEVNTDIKLLHHWQLPNFRLILIDENRALVSFYERGKDALRTMQIEIRENTDAQFNLLNWFKLFYDKVVKTEELLNHRNLMATSKSNG